MGNALLYRMASGFPGDISRKTGAVVETVTLDTAKPFAGYGLPGKKVAGKLVPVEAGDAGAVVTHFIARPYPTQADFATAKIGDGMRSGYMTVKNNAGAPAEDGAVYVRIANGTASQPIGGIEAAAHADTVAIPGAVFMSAADADGNVEIRFNV
ncbi:MAG TPA: hypothetical protein VNT52_00905 [Acidimicrobiales bacterium]|nr:hypothetical protein [Acidimicrobiales bacterium]